VFNKYTMDISKIIISIAIPVLHIIIVSVSLFIVLFGKNTKILFILLIILSLVYLQVILANGCILSKFELYNLSEIIKRCFFIDEVVHTNNIEKILVGLTLAACFYKLAIILFMEKYKISLPSNLI
jgi:hypothetical protein